MPRFHLFVNNSLCFSTASARARGRRFQTACLLESSLSYVESGERRRNTRVFEDYSKTNRLDELLGEYTGRVPTCPICGSEVVACEGRDEPFYWRCVVGDCYSRSIDQPPIRDGIVRCYNCNGSVEIGEWGGKPCW